MRLDKTFLLTATLALSAALPVHAQQAFGIEPGQVPVLETSLGYSFLHANAPPGQCGCFSANGGFGSIVFNTPHGFSIVGDLNAVHAGNVAGTQSITVFSYLFGPRYSLRSMSKRFTPYGQVLGGASQEFSSYTAVQNLQGAAFSVGGGISTVLKPHLGWTIVEADWIHSYIPNAQNNLQNDIRVSTAITFRLGPR
jgi:outer membrane immunogenic protein